MRFFFTFFLALLALWLLASSTEAVSLRGFGCTGCNCEFVETTVDEGECQEFDSSPSASGRFYCEDGNIRLEVYQGTANCFSESSQTITVDEGECINLNSYMSGQAWCGSAGSAAALRPAWLLILVIKALPMGLRNV